MNKDRLKAEMDLLQQNIIIYERIESENDVWRYLIF